MIKLYEIGLFSWLLTLKFTCLQQGSKRMPGTAVTKSVVANEPGGRKREEIFVDVIEKISVTFSSSVRIIFVLHNISISFHWFHFRQHSLLEIN